MTEKLRAWLLSHVDHPYPTDEEKRELCKATDLSMNQISNWFINARRRILTPVESAPTAKGQAKPRAGAAGSGAATHVVAHHQSHDAHHGQYHHNQAHYEQEHDDDDDDSEGMEF